MSMTLSFRGESMGILPLDDIRRHPPVQHTPPQNLTNLHAPDRLANLGRLRLRLHRRLHRRGRRHTGRSTSSSSPNRRLRTRLLCNRPPNLLRRHRRAHHVPDVARCLVEEERHAFAAEVLADDVELHAVLVDHVCDSVGKDDKLAKTRNRM